MNKSRHVTFRCTQKDYDKIQAIAKEYNMPVSTYIIGSVLEAISNDRYVLDQQKDKS